MAGNWDIGELVYLSAMTIVCTVSVVANGLVLLALCKFPSLRNTTNTLIGSLALADLLVSSIAAPISAMIFHGVPRDLYACIFVNCLVIAFTNFSVMELLLITIERFLAVKYPIMHRKNVTKTKLLIVVGATFLAGMLISFVPLMGWYRRGDFRDCSFAVIPLTFLVYVIFLGFVLPCLVFMIFAYTNVFLIFRKRQRRSTIYALAHPSELHKPKNKKLQHYVKCIAALVSVFVINWLPISITHSLNVFLSLNLSLDVQYVLMFLCLSGAAINPFIYAFFIKSFQRAIRRMLGCSYISRHSMQITLNTSVTTTNTCLRKKDENWVEEGPTISNLSALVMEDEARKQGTLITSTASALDMEDERRHIEELSARGESTVAIEDKNRAAGKSTISVRSALDIEYRNRPIESVSTSGVSALNMKDKNKTNEKFKCGGSTSNGSTSQTTSLFHALSSPILSMLTVTGNEDV